jgi:cytochrome c oxidase cbb3-type subunit 3
MMRSTRGLTVVLTMGSLFVGAACGKTTPARTPGGNIVQVDTQSAAPPAVRHDERVFAGGSAPSAISFPNPFAGEAMPAAEGAQLFPANNCDGCHGGGAVGWVGPSLTAGRWRFGGADAEIFQSIYYGRPHGMPAYGGLLPPDMIWKLVTYIKSLPPPKDVPTESW